MIVAPVICREPSTFIPSVTLTPVPGGGTSTTSAVVIDSLAFNKIDHSAASPNYTATQAVPEFQPAWTMTSLTPAICTVSGNTVIRVSNGEGVIKFTGPSGISKVEKINFTSASHTEYVWTGFSGTSKSSALSTPILTLLDPAKPNNYYNPTVPVPTPLVNGSTFAKNPNCWASVINLTGSAITTGLAGNVSTANSGALITPRHWVGVRHFGDGVANMGPGQKLAFADSAGIVHVRTVLRRHLDQGDLIVCLLSSDLPASVTPFKFANDAMFDFPIGRAYGMGWQLNQQKHISPVVFGHVISPQAPSQNVSSKSIGWNNFANGTWAQIADPNHLLYPARNMTYAARTGDSGGAIGGYYNGQTYLISLFTSPLSGNDLYTSGRAAFYNSIIAGLDAAQGISTGYTVGIINFP